MPEYLLRALFVFTGLLLTRQLLLLLPRARFAPRLLLHAVMGLAWLLIGNTVGALFGLRLGLNAVTLPIAAALGMPGVAALWALRYLL